MTLIKLKAKTGTKLWWWYIFISMYVELLNVAVDSKFEMSFGTWKFKYKQTLFLVYIQRKLTNQFPVALSS